MARHRSVRPATLEQELTLERHHYGAGTIVMKNDEPELRTRQRYGASPSAVRRMRWFVLGSSIACLVHSEFLSNFGRI
jgi:hypothetical protein